MYGKRCWFVKFVCVTSMKTLSHVSRMLKEFVGDQFNRSLE